MTHYQKLCESVTTPGEQSAVMTTEFPAPVWLRGWSLHLRRDGYGS